MGNQSEFWESPRRNVTKLSSSDFTLLNWSSFRCQASLVFVGWARNSSLERDTARNSTHDLLQTFCNTFYSKNFSSSWHFCWTYKKSSFIRFGRGRKIVNLLKGKYIWSPFNMFHLVPVAKKFK
jgi:hypothetical protein